MNRLQRKLDNARKRSILKHIDILDSISCECSGDEYDKYQRLIERYSLMYSRAIKCQHKGEQAGYMCRECRITVP